jgi:opacity protein-like surface antigen
MIPIEPELIVYFNRFCRYAKISVKKCRYSPVYKTDYFVNLFINMRIFKIIALAALLVTCSGLSTLSAQVQLERISITERADGLGYVVRFHLTEMVGAYDLSQPETDLVQMILQSPGMTPVEMIPITESEIITHFGLTQMNGQVGVEIRFAEGVFFRTDVYPDVNGRDLLLSLQYTNYAEAVAIAEGMEPIIRMEEEPEVEVTARPAEEPVQIEEIVPEVRPERPLRLSIGFMTGLSIASVSGNTFSKGLRDGVAIGISFDIGLPYTLPYNIQTGIETGIYYAQKGFKRPSPNFLNAETAEFDYIEIPVMGKFSYNLLDFVSPHILIGPYTGFMINAERVRSDDSRRDLDDQSSEIVFGGLMGAGLDIKLGETILSAQIRGSLDLSNVFSSDFNNEDIGHFKHRYLSVLIGVRF